MAFPDTPLHLSLFSRIFEKRLWIHLEIFASFKNDEHSTSRDYYWVAGERRDELKLSVGSQTSL